MEIRKATHEDLPEIQSLAEQMHQESRFAKYPLNLDALLLTVRASFVDDSPYVMLVADSGEDLVGGFLGCVTNHPLCHFRMAADLALFVRPDRRGALVASRLLKEYEVWAWSMGAAEVCVGVNTGVTPERTGRLLEHLGYSNQGHLYLKEPPI